MPITTATEALGLKAQANLRESVPGLSTIADDVQVFPMGTTPVWCEIQELALPAPMKTLAGPSL